MSRLVHSYHGIVVKEYETNGELSYVVIDPSRAYYTFHGEMAYHDASRYWHDIVLPMIHGGKYVGTPRG